MTFADWNHGLLFAVVLIIMGAMLFVSAATTRDRLLALGVLSQGIVVTFVVSGSFHGRSELLLAALALAALALVVLACLWSLLVGGTVLASDVIDEARTGDEQ